MLAKPQSEMCKSDVKKAFLQNIINFVKEKKDALKLEELCSD